MELATGTMVTDQVRLLEPLGHGGMGSVWMGEDLARGVRVAVKFISTELAGRYPELRQRFKRESTISEQLSSEHAVKTFDHGITADGTPYIVMELLEGTDLTHAVAVRGPLSLVSSNQLVHQVGDVLARAHELGIVHRDIKPDNIFLLDSGQDLVVKVLDFGIAKTDGPDGGTLVTKTGAVVGTPDFMSPEQAISSKYVDFRTDLFSLGVVAYYALTGELPYESTDEQPLWRQLTSGRHIPPSERVASLPAQLDGWFEQALAPRPEGRFQSAREMVDGLEAIVADTRGAAPSARYSWTGREQADGLDPPEEEETLVMRAVDRAAILLGDSGSASKPPTPRRSSVPPPSVPPRPRRAGGLASTPPPPPQRRSVPPTSRRSSIPPPSIPPPSIPPPSIPPPAGAPDRAATRPSGPSDGSWSVPPPARGSAAPFVTPGADTHRAARRLTAAIVIVVGGASVLAILIAVAWWMLA